MPKNSNDKNINKALVSLFSNIDVLVENHKDEKYSHIKYNQQAKKKEINVSNVIKAAFLLKKYRTHIANHNKSIPSVQSSEKQQPQQNSDPVTKEYIRYFIRKTKPYRRFRPFDDPVSYTKTSDRKKRKFNHNSNNLVTVLNHLNLDDDEIRSELYKYDRAILPYKNFKYLKLARRKLCFTGLAKKQRQIYIHEALNTMPTIHQDMRHQYTRNPFLYIKRYFENSLSYKDIQKNNLQQIFFAIFLTNSRQKHPFAIDYDE